MNQTNFKFKRKWKIKWLTIGLSFFFVGSLSFGISCATLKNENQTKSRMLTEVEIANTVAKKLLEQKHFLNVFNHDTLKTVRAVDIIKSENYQKQLLDFIKLIIKEHLKSLNNLVIHNEFGINFNRIGLSDFKILKNSVVAKITYQQNNKFFKSTTEIVINGFKKDETMLKNSNTKSKNFNKVVIKEIAQIINEWSPSLLNFASFFEPNFDNRRLKKKKTLISFIEKFVRKIIIENDSSFNNIFKQGDQFFKINPNLVYVIDVSTRPFTSETFVDSSDFMYVKIIYDKYDLNDINEYQQIILNGFNDLMLTNDRFS